MTASAAVAPPPPLPALAEVYHEHHVFVWRILRRQGIPHDQIDDAVHDVFLVVARRLHEFEGRSTIRTWLFAIAKRVGQQTLRKVHREGDRRLALRHAGGPTTGDEPHRRTDAAETLRALLDRLEPGRRQVFVLSELEGMTAPEIGAALGLKVPTVYSRLRLARRDLERMLERSLEGSP